MRRKDKERLDRLRRRRDFLASRISEYQPTGNPSHDKAELAALNWAIRLIEECDTQGVLEDLYVGGWQ